MLESWAKSYFGSLQWPLCFSCQSTLFCLDFSDTPSFFSLISEKAVNICVVRMQVKVHFVAALKEWHIGGFLCGDFSKSKDEGRCNLSLQTFARSLLLSSWKCYPTTCAFDPQLSIAFRSWLPLNSQSVRSFFLRNFKDFIWTISGRWAFGCSLLAWFVFETRWFWEGRLVLTPDGGCVKTSDKRNTIQQQ